MAIQLQYSCPENPMDRGAWRATVHGVIQSGTQLKQLSRHSFIHSFTYLFITGLTHEVMEAKKSHDLPTVRQRTGKPKV